MLIVTGHGVTLRNGSTIVSFVTEIPETCTYTRLCVSDFRRERIRDHGHIGGFPMDQLTAQYPLHRRAKRPPRQFVISDLICRLKPILPVDNIT